MVSERAARGGQHDRVDRAARAWPSRHWKSAECSLSTGQQQPSAPLPGLQRQIAGRDEALLVRERERDAALERPQRRADAGEADDGVEDEVGLGASRSSVTSPPTCDVLDAELGGELVERLRARGERADGEVGVRGDTSSAWRPIEPVAPSSAIRLSRTGEG